MTPAEYAKLQRDYLIKKDKESALKLIVRFEQIRNEVADFLLLNAPNEVSAESLIETSFLEKILDEVTEKIDDLSTSAAQIVSRAQKSVINFAKNSFKKFLKSEKPEIETSIFEKDIEAVNKLIGRTQTGESLKKSFQNLKEPVRAKAEAALIEGFERGESHTQIAKRLDDASELGKWRSLAIARTETNEAYRAATRDFYQAAEVQKYIWMSALSPNTCLICWRLHGEVFNTNKKIFSHPNCRCVLVPYFGQKVATGLEKLAGLEKGFQRQILGASRFDLYEKGTPIKDFVGSEESKEFGKKHFIKPLYELDSEPPIKAGAFGNWRRIQEKFDPSIVKQTSEKGVSCVSAVGEMLLKGRKIKIPQSEILDIIGEPADVVSLARALNQFDTESKDGFIWRGIVTDEQSLDVVLKQKTIGVFLADDFVRDKMLHAVVVEGQTKKGLIRIKDPFDQTSYKMTRADFLVHWGGQVILRWFP